MSNHCSLYPSTGQHGFRNLFLFGLCWVWIFLSSCEKKQSVEGIWYSTIHLVDGEERLETNTTILDFHQGHLYTVKFRDYASSGSDSMQIDTSEYQVTDNGISLKEDALKGHIEGDTLLVLESTGFKSYFKRVPDEIRHLSLSKEEILGGAILESSVGKDSVDFINDSTLLHTGRFLESHPFESWFLHRYKGITFLSMPFLRTPVFIISSASEDGLGLMWAGEDTCFLRRMLTPTRNFKAPLLGCWREISGTSVQGPPPPNMTVEDQIMLLRIQEETVELYQYQQHKVMDWKMSSDGNRLYFPAYLNQWNGSWKVVQVSDSTLELMVPHRTMFFEEPTIFKKISAAELP